MGRLVRLGFADAARAAQLITSDLGLDVDPGDRPGALTGAAGGTGRDETVLQAVAAAADPDLALAGLARIAGAERGEDAADLRATLRQLARSGRTVILSSHDMAQVEAICDSVTVLHHGRVVFTGGLDVMRGDAPDGTWRLFTSDDEAALTEAGAADEVKAARRDEGGLTVHAAQDKLDAYVLALGRQGIAVRGLEPDVTALESLFFQLTRDAEAPAPEETP